MGLLPSLNIGPINVTETVQEFLDLLRSIDSKLDKLIDLKDDNNPASR